MKSGLSNKIYIGLSIGIVMLGMLALATIQWLNKYASNSSIDAILFHLQTPAADLSAMKSYLFRIVTAVIGASIVSGIFLLYYKKTTRYKYTAKLHTFIISIFTFISISLLAFKLDTPSYFKNRMIESSFIQDNYQMPHITPASFPTQKRNLIILMLESMDSSFTTSEVFNSPLTPNLQKMQSENISYSGIYQTFGTSWTIGSNTGMLFGLPLIVPFDDGQEEKDFNSFLPSANNILNILDENGYSINIIAGSNITFAGTRSMFNTHTTEPNIYDKLYFEQILSEQEQEEQFSSAWGMRDKHLYENAKQIITHKLSQEQPFFVMLKTVDTHNKADAYNDYPRIYNDSRDAFIAADIMAADFVRWVKDQPFYENTTVIVIGDHEYMADNIEDHPLKMDRTIYNVFINSALTNHQKNRNGTMLDMAPTILESIGVSLPNHRFGLGSSLASSEKTLYEKLGNDKLIDELGKRSSFYLNFFNQKN